MATSTTLSGRPVTNGSAPAAGLGGSSARQRNVPWVVLGVLLVAGSALGFAAWSSSSDARQSALVAARDIPAGATISARDLRTANLSIDGPVRFVPGSRLSALVGKRAAAMIPAGGLLSPLQVSDGRRLGSGEAVVGVALAPGAAPVADLQAGDAVDVVAVEAPGSANATGQPVGVISAAQVYAVRSSGDAAGTVVVSLRVPVADAEKVAAAAGAERIRLVLRGGAGS